MKILMLVNWKIEYTNEKPVDKQPPDYVVPGEKYWFFRYLPNNIEVEVIDTHSLSILEKFEKQKLRFYIWQTLKVLPYLNRYDIILSHGTQSAIVLCLWRKLFGKGRYKHIVFDIGAFNSAKENGLALKLMQFASKTLDGVIYHTSTQIEYYKKCHPWLLNKSCYIAFGTDSDFFKVTPKKSSMERKYILCVGYNKRDWNTLIEAYAVLRKHLNVNEIPELRLVGNENIANEDNDIVVLPNVSINELVGHINKAVFCVLPLKSHNYSYGQMTLLQQMALGKAVIVANVPSIRDYVENGKDAILYEPENVEQLAILMEDLLMNQQKRYDISENASKTICEKWNERIMANAIWTFLKSYGDE